MNQCVGTVRWHRRADGPRIGCDEPPDRSSICRYRRNMKVIAELGMGGEECVRGLETAVPGGGFDETRSRQVHSIRKACFQLFRRNPGMQTSCASASMGRAASAIPMSAGSHPKASTIRPTSSRAAGSFPQ